MLKEEEKMELKEKNKRFFESFHQIDGFYPEAELIAYKNTNDKSRVIERLPLSVKEVWFHAMYPDGAIRHKILRQDKDLVVVTCFLYRDYRDDANQFLRSETVAIAPEQSIKRDPTKGEEYFYAYTEGEIIQKTVNSAKARSENYCLSKAGFGCQYETSYLEEEEDLDDLEMKAAKALPPSSTPAAIPGMPKKNGVMDDIKEIIHEDSSKDSSSDNGYVPSRSDPEAVVPQKSILDYQKGRAKPMDESQEVKSDTFQDVKKESSIMSLDHAYAFSPSDPKYHTLKEIYNDNPDRLLYMVKRVTGIEKQAIFTIIHHDERLLAMAKRIGLVA